MSNVVLNNIASGVQDSANFILNTAVEWAGRVVTVIKAGYSYVAPCVEAGYKAASASLQNQHAASISIIALNILVFEAVFYPVGTIARKIFDESSQFKNSLIGAVNCVLILGSCVGASLGFAQLMKLPLPKKSVLAISAATLFVYLSVRICFMKDPRADQSASV